MNRKTLKRRLLASSVLVSAVVSTALPALAQDEAGSDSEARQETVVVTGSRIANSNLTSASPITNVSSDDITLSNTVNAEQFLNTLPQVIPGFDSSSNNPGIGEATVDLRGLGAGRTLVLVNGRRYVTSNQNAGAVDLNTIPAALVERVDILTGGASATYGSDAMSGVVNFIMKDDFQGLEAAAGYEQTQEGDGEIYTLSTTIGGNFGGDRGNAVLSLEYTGRESVLQGDRPEAFFSLSDGGAAAGFLETGSVNIPSTFALDLDVNYTDLLGIQPPCNTEGTVLDGGICTTDSFGFIFSPDGPGVDVFINSGPNTNRYNYAPVNYLQIPQERYSIYGSARYDITDTVEAYAQAVFVSSQTEQLLAPTPVFTNLTVNLDNPFLANDPQALAALTTISGGADSDGDGVVDATFSAGRRFKELGGRLSDIRNDSFQINGGLRGNITDTWAFDVFASYGQAETAVSQTGNVSLSAYQEEVRAGRANIFDEDGLSQEVVDAIAVTGVITGQTNQAILSATASGDLYGFTSSMAKDPVLVAIGVEYREEELVTFGAGLDSDTRGFNAAPSIGGGFDVYETFFEVNAPLIQDAPGIKDLTFSGAYRYSDYSTAGGVDSYAGGLSYTPFEGLRLRGQYQQAVRAPNIGELFSPQSNGFPNIADPCSGGRIGGFNDLDAATQGIVRANCEGSAAYQVPVGAAGTPLQVNAQIEGLFFGNPDLVEETAETITLGAVWEPEFVDNLALTVDYFDIQIEDVIAHRPAQRIFDFCYINGLTDFCDLIQRNPDGTVNIFTSLIQNSAELSTKGLDVSIDYFYETEKWGTFGLYSLITWTDENNFVPLAGEDPIEAVGYYGATVGEPKPEWSFNTRLDWAMGKYGARLRWTRISEVEDDLFANGGAPDLFVTGIDAYDQFDLTTFYDLNDNVSFTFGIENLLDTDFELIGDDAAQQSNTYPATYDTLGRTFFGRVNVKF